jgi:diguanylate cyclase (GGDEF)-like protein
MSARRSEQPRTPQPDATTGVIAALLPLHTASTLDWLVDATCTAAEGTLNASYTFVYLDDANGGLERKSPASDLRRRALHRALDAFGKAVPPARIDARSAPALTDALARSAPSPAPASDLFRGLIGESEAAAAQKALGVQSLAAVPLVSNGERVGALLLMLVEQPQPDRLRAFADHVAIAAVNLRRSHAASDQGAIDVVRSVFDARKLEAELQKELARAVRYKREVSIAVIEATNLRLLRDKYGRFLTDRLLENLGSALAQGARDIDVIGAYKESGYTMVLTEASHAGAATAARRMLTAAQSASLGADDVPGLELHLVVGWGSCPSDGVTSDALFAAAERRMYDPSEQVA